MNSALAFKSSGVACAGGSGDDDDDATAGSARRLRPEAPAPAARARHRDERHRLVVAQRDEGPAADRHDGLGCSHPVVGHKNLRGDVVGGATRGGRRCAWRGPGCGADRRKPGARAFARVAQPPPAPCGSRASRRVGARTPPARRPRQAAAAAGGQPGWRRLQRGWRRRRGEPPRGAPARPAPRRTAAAAPGRPGRRRRGPSRGLRPRGRLGGGGAASARGVAPPHRRRPQRGPRGRPARGGQGQPQAAARAAASRAPRAGDRPSVGPKPRQQPRKRSQPPSSTRLAPAAAGQPARPRPARPASAPLTRQAPAKVGRGAQRRRARKRAPLARGCANTTSADARHAGRRHTNGNDDLEQVWYIVPHSIFDARRSPKRPPCTHTLSFKGSSKQRDALFQVFKLDTRARVGGHRAARNARRP